eukprot:scaffold109472_cov48-Phaeocystis_antarctica.AAC.1
MSTVQSRGVISSAAAEAEAWREDIQAARGSSARRAFLQAAVSKAAAPAYYGLHPQPYASRLQPHVSQAATLCIPGGRLQGGAEAGAHLALDAAAMALPRGLVGGSRRGGRAAA